MKRKSLIILMIAIFLLLLLGATKVDAATTTGDQNVGFENIEEIKNELAITENILSSEEKLVNQEETIMANIPDTITVDPSKSETAENKLKEIITIPEEYEITIIGSGSSDNTITSYTIGLTLKSNPSKILATKYISFKYTCDLLEKVKEVLPNTMEIDIPEIEYEKATEIVEKNIEEILEKNNIDIQEIEKKGIELTTWTAPIYFGKESFYNAYIDIKYNSVYESKTIKLTYNNHDDYNSTDEQFVKNLKIQSPKYYEVDLDFLTNISEENNYFTPVEKYFTKLINDSSITVKAESGAGGTDGGLNLWSWGTCIAIFRNGVLYNIIDIGDECTVPVITVPNTVVENKINDYVIDLITKYYSEFGKEITSIEKGTKDVIGIDITNGYTVYSNYGTASCIIIRKQEAIKVEDETTNIKLDADTTKLPKNTILETRKIEEEKILNLAKESLSNVSSKFVVFDITLKSEGVKVQPDGKVKISIPVPSNFDTSNLVVYRIEESGAKIEYDVNIVEVDNIKYAQFETDHFSTYALTEKVSNNKTNNELEDDAQDDTPDTGIVETIYFSLSITIISALGIVVFKKKEKNSKVNI